MRSNTCFFQRRLWMPHLADEWFVQGDNGTVLHLVITRTLSRKVFPSTDSIRSKDYS